MWVGLGAGGIRCAFGRRNALVVAKSRTYCKVREGNRSCG
ncbi:hypothetical protein NY78_3436 [Desulfovibrio sp. TomC]|nr:hypothetical protein NY78_3436 [Desulfovibrio sp. TomC]